MTDASRAAPITTAQQIAFCEREELKEIGLTDLANAKGLSIIAGFHLERAAMYRSIAAALRPLLTTEDKVPAEDGAEGRD